jgi:hypothetical protein
MRKPYTSFRLFSATVCAALGCAGACGGGAFDGAEPSAGSGGANASGSGADSGGSSGSGGSGPSSASGSPHEAGGSSAGAAPSGQCSADLDCEASTACAAAACVEGTCLEALADEGAPCEGGVCDAEGQCIVSTCESDEKDGDETGRDCGGSCEPCPNGEGCGGDQDCLSGVCDVTCQPSSCTDGATNGTESDMDCGGTCALKCELGRACTVIADCAVPAGDRPEMVRCLEGKCTSTKPPSAGGAHRYWQDFASVRLLHSEQMCGAVDDVCLRAVSSGYPMSGIATNGEAKPLTAASLFTPEGALGGGLKLDGSYCLVRPTTNLSMNDEGALTAMAWVKTQVTQAPWEAAVLGGNGHYFIAVDANPAAERFLAAVATTQSTDFMYRRSTNTAEVPSGEWHHVAVTYDSGAAKVIQYVDGEVVHTSEASGTIVSEPVDMYLGCRRDGTTPNQFFKGTIDEVVLYPRALAAQELSDYVRRTAP